MVGCGGGQHGGEHAGVLVEEGLDLGGGGAGWGALGGGA